MSTITIKYHDNNLSGQVKIETNEPETGYISYRRYRVYNSVTPIVDNVTIESVTFTSDRASKATGILATYSQLSFDFTSPTYVETGTVLEGYLQHGKELVFKIRIYSYENGNETNEWLFNFNLTNYIKFMKAYEAWLN